MSDLKRQHCEACRADSPLATPEERAEWTPQIPDWQVVEEGGVEKLRRVFRFPDFAKAMGFAELVGELAEAEGHHPVLTVEWGRVTVLWWTHKIKGLHRNDFVVAAKTDTLYELGVGSPESGVESPE